MTSNIVLYVGCGLTRAPQEFRDAVKAFKERLRQEGFPVLEFVGLHAGTDLDVWTHDLSNVDGCTHMIAVADENSTGLGLEIGRALWFNNQQKRILCIQHVDAKVTRMIPGGSQAGEYSHRTFTNWDEAVELVKVFVAANPVTTQLSVAAE